MRQKKILVATLLLMSSLAFFAAIFIRPMATKTRNIASSSTKEKRFAQARLETDKAHAKPEAPDEFVRYHREIRTRESENAPDYPPNYKIAALRQALQAVSLNKASAPLPWIERGPGNVPGRTRGLIVDPDDPSFNTWFAGSVGGGIWKTTDGGNSWENKTPALPNLATTTIVMANSNHQILYAGTGEGFFNVDAIKGDGIWKSFDRGENWAQLSSTAGNNDFAYVNRLAVHPLEANVVIAATNTGILRSTDGGASWTKVYGDDGFRVQDLVANPRNFNTLYASVNGVGVIKSTDAGRNWVSSSSGITSPLRLELAIAPADTTRIYAAVQANATPASALYVSRNVGVSWSQVIQASGATVSWLGNQGWYDNAIAVHPYDANIVFVGGIQIYRMTVTPANTMTVTRVINLTNRPTSVVHVDQHNLTTVPTAPANNRFMILNANDGGVAVSQDGGDNWARRANGYNTSQFYGADKAPGVSAYIGGMQDNGTWKSPADPNATTSWLAQLGGDGFEVSWHYKDPNKIIGSIQFNSLYRTLDGGQSWSPATTGLGAVGAGQAPFIVTLAKSQSDPDLLFVIGATGVWRSDNFGADWTSSPIAPQDWGTLTHGQVEISLANPQVVWAGNRMSNNGKINVSTDGGLTFNPTSLYQDATLGRVTGLGTHPTDEATAYALFSIARAPKILRTTNLGQTWMDISGFAGGASSSNGFPDVATYSVLVLPHNPSEIWAGTEIGLFISKDSGASWSYANNGLPAASIWRLAVVDDQIIAATHGRGLWSVTIPELLNAPPPVVTLSPVLSRLGQSPGGAMTIDFKLRSAYDSTIVFVDGNRFLHLANTAPKDSIINYPITVAKTITVSISAFKNGRVYKSATRAINVTPVIAPQASYANDFNAPSTDFFGNGFSIATPAGFNHGAIHSLHPYQNNTTLTYQLQVPIIVAATDAFLQYDDMALVEPGEPGTVFGDPDFYDYVIVEATADGINWKPLADGYDARFDPAWEAAYENNAAGDPSLFRTHRLNLLNTFAAGDKIFVRFRLFADPGANGWGWAIDNLFIQQATTLVAAEPSLPTHFRLVQNYPNPFNPSTTIKYALPKPAEVRLTIFNAFGQKIRMLVDNERKEPGTHAVEWDGRNDADVPVATGLYFYKLQTKDYVRTLKMLLVK